MLTRPPAPLAFNCYLCCCAIVLLTVTACDSDEAPSACSGSDCSASDATDSADLGAETDVATDPPSDALDSDTTEADTSADAAADSDAPTEVEDPVDDTVTDTAEETDTGSVDTPPLRERSCTDLADEDFDGFTDCDDVAECGDSPECVPGLGAVGVTCTAATECAGERPLCRSEEATGYPSGACSHWCSPALQDCGEGLFCLGEAPARGECGVLCDLELGTGCRDAYRCDPYQIIEDGHPVDIGVCVPACQNDDDCPVLGACFDDAGQFRSGRCVEPESCRAGQDIDRDGRYLCEDEDCAFIEECDRGPTCDEAVELTVIEGDPVEVSADNTGGTMLFSGSCTGNFGGHELLYTVTAGEDGQTGVLSLTMGPGDSGLGPDLGSYLRTTCDDRLSEVGCADNAFTDETEFSDYAVYGGQPYTLVVDAIGATAVGPFEMTLTFTPDDCGDGDITGIEACDEGVEPPEAGDGCSATCQPELDVLCDGATPLTEGGLAGDATGGNSFFFDASCLLPENAAHEDIWTFVAPSTGEANILVGDTSGLTDLAVYVRTTCEDREAEVACADEVRDDGAVESLTFDVVEGTAYWVFIDGTLSDFDVGPYTLFLTLPPD